MASPLGAAVCDLGFGKAMEVAARFRKRQLPALDKAGWPRPQENIAQPPIWSGRGGLIHYRLIGGLDEPPRLRRCGGFATSFLMAQPPRLIQGGELPSHTPHQRSWTTAL